MCNIVVEIVISFDIKDIVLYVIKIICFSVLKENYFLKGM
nr:MAG TPA: hypothetical protein [Caudoviricetes sp.]